MNFLERVRLKLESPNPDGRGAGFITVTSWSVERENGCSTNSTPSHTVQTIDRSSITSVQRHRRCQSLPPIMHHRSCLSQGKIDNLEMQLFFQISNSSSSSFTTFSLQTFFQNIQISFWSWWRHIRDGSYGRTKNRFHFSTAALVSSFNF